MKHRIVVLGAGYAGAHAAGRLARTLHPDDVEITLVNADPDFVERVRMHQLATGQVLRPRPLREVYAGTGVIVRQAMVTAVDVERSVVAVTEPDAARRAAGEIGYDTLVYALGSTAAGNAIPGVADYTHHLAGRPAALRLRSRLGELDAGARVVVVGGGLTGIEAVTELAETRPDLDVALVAAGGVGDRLGQRARRHLRAVLHRLGVTVHAHTEVARVDRTAVVTAAGQRIPAEMTVWAAGFGVGPIAADSAVEVADGGRIVVDDTMRSVSHPQVYAVGDAGIAVGAGGAPLRMSCASGIPMAWRAADAIAARLTGRAVPQNSAGYVGGTIGYFAQCISLGRRDGIFQPVSFDDRPRSLVLTGATAARVKEWVCAGAAWSIGHPTLGLPRRRRRIAAGTPTPATTPVG